MQSLMFPRLSITWTISELSKLYSTVIRPSFIQNQPSFKRLSVTNYRKNLRIYLVDSREFRMRIVNRLMFRNNFKITKHLNRSITSILIIYNSLPLRSTAIDARYSASTQSKIFDVRIWRRLNLITLSTCQEGWCYWHALRKIRVAYSEFVRYSQHSRGETYA